jgi:chemotaxis protein CheX
MVMPLGERVRVILNGTIESVKGAIPHPCKINKASLFTAPLTQSSMGVLIGLTGNVRGQFINEEYVSVFQQHWENDVRTGS